MSKRFLIITAALVLSGFFVYAAVRRKREKPEPNEAIDNNPNNWTMTNPNGIPGTKNFKLSEFDCHDGTKVPTAYYGNVQQLMNNLQVLRDYLGKPIYVNSGYRSPAWNKEVGGVGGSMHLRAMAADIRVPGYSPGQVKAAILHLISAGSMQDGGIGLYPTFVHYDVGSARRW